MMTEGDHRPAMAVSSCLCSFIVERDLSWVGTEDLDEAGHRRHRLRRRRRHRHHSYSGNGWASTSGAGPAVSKQRRD